MTQQDKLMTSMSFLECLFSNTKLGGSLALISLIIALIFWLIGVKEEKLICNIQQKTCIVQRTSNLNIKSEEFITNPYDVSDIYVKRFKTSHFYRTFTRQFNVREEYYYAIYFKNIDGSSKRIFKGKYMNKDQAETVKSTILTKFLLKDNIIEVVKS